ncbi:4-coumarate--CoA ligase [Massilia sp. UMI-21]|nr:4-coumarate--CoA ligase [Massilia sp. UMI-21]
MTDLRLAPWWTQRPALLRFVADLLAGELGALRHDPGIRPGAWSEALSLQHDLGLDSLEFLHVAGSLAAALQMHHSGIEDYLLARRSLGDWVDLAGAALAHHDAEIQFSSSGSSGQPKRCLHALPRLEQEAQALAALFPGRRRLLVAVPSHHIYGFLFSQLLPRHLGLAPEQVVCIRARLPSQLARHAAPGDLVIGHPLFWEAASAAGQAFAPDVVGVSSTAPCPDAVVAAVTHAGLAALFQVYGSSETGGLGWRRAHTDDYTLLPYLARGAEGAAQDDSGRSLLRTLPDGALEALRAQDALDWRGERTFAVGRRCDGAVQVGGVNVFPDRVREVLLAHPGVLDAAVRLMRPDEGVRLKAFIVPRPGHPDLLHSLRNWIDTRLPAPERPKALTVGSQLPRTAMGKAADWSIT